MNAQQLKNAILQEAIEGRLVPQDPNDEPASALLARIRQEKEQLVKEGKLKKKDLVVKPISEDEIPFDIPETWEWVRVKDIFIINPKVIADDDTDAAFIPMEKIEACYGSKYSYAIRKWKDIKSSFTSFADGDVAFAKITPCFQNRKSMILENLPNGIGAGTTELKVLRQYSETIDRKYLLYFLASSYFIDEAVFKGTANQQRIIVGYLENKLFPLPPLAEQKRIVSKIEELFPKVEEYGKAQDALNKLNTELPERLKKSILQEAIEGRLVPQDPNDEPASVLLAKIRKEKEQLVKEGKLKKSALKEIPFLDDERPFEIPESWEWCKLGWIGDWGAGATPAKGNPDFYNNGTIPWLRTGELNNGFVYNSEIKVTPKALEKCSLRMCEVGDVLIAMYGATIGKVAIAGIKLTTNQACCACTPYCIYNKYLMYYLMASKNTFIEMGEGGAQPNISREKIVAFPLALPPLAEQHRIVEKLEQVLGEIDKLKK